MIATVSILPQTNVSVMSRKSLFSLQDGKCACHHVDLRHFIVDLRDEFAKLLEVTDNLKKIAEIIVVIYNTSKISTRSKLIALVCNHYSIDANLAVLHKMPSANVIARH